jgi:two-component system cell cycle sensor histidine kinase/response regulator CckA
MMSPTPLTAERPAQILVVEDEVIVAKDIERSLTALGYEVIGRAGTAEDAVQRARAGRPDLILMDIRLPGKLDGVGAAAIIHDELHIPVIFLSAFNDGETVGRAKATQPFGYIVKPFNEGELRCAIELALYKFQADATLRKRERLMTTTLRSIGDGVVTTNARQEITSLNRVAEKLTGWSGEDACGRKLAEIMRLEDEDTGTAVESPLREAMEARGVTYLRDRVRLIGKCGSVAIDDSAAAIVDDDQLLGGVLVFRDVTARREAEESVRRLEAKYRLLFENAADGLFLLSLEGALLETNRRAEEIHGARREELIGQRFFTFLLPQLTREGFIKADGVEIARPDGARRIVDLTASVVGLGEDKVILAIERDVTEETQLGEQIRQYQRMESIAQLTASVAHDFNNVLAVILANSHCLLKSLDASDPNREIAAEIQEAGQRGASLTGQLLAFSRRQVLKREVVNLNDVVHNVEKMLLRLIGADIELSFLPDAALALGTADAGQLAQEIMNLVINARDAMPRGGKIRLETSNVELDGQYAADHLEVVPGHYVMLAVSDTGTGMDAATKRRVFEPFFTTKERGKGTGLGLSTCYGIVKQSGGSICLYSEPGEGTVFKVYLPRSEGTVGEAARGAPAVQGCQRGTETILLVDDDPGVRKVVARILEERGYRVVVASDGTEAVRLAFSQVGSIHLLLSDVIIPGASGLELLKNVRAHSPAARVLFMSGYTDHPVLREDVLQPQIDFLQKPFTPDGLAGKVRAVLDR